MKIEFSGKKISGLLAVVPANERNFVDDMVNFNFPVSRSLKLKEVMGYDRHRIVDGPVCASDLAVAGLQNLFDQGKLKPHEIDALILVTQSPDYLMPGTASVIQGRLNLHHDILCLDLNQGCAGFVVGLIQGFALLEQSSVDKVVLINVDVLSRKVSPRDRNSYPLIGDACTISVLERSGKGSIVKGAIKMDGSRREALKIPAGGFRQPASPSTAVMTEDAEGNYRALDNLVMDGSAVFNFVLTEVPVLIREVLDMNEISVDHVDAFLFHQPNRFMLQKLADKLGIPYEKMPSNVVEHFGNSSGATIPLAAVWNLDKRLLESKLKVCIAGFGVGLTWSALIMELGPLEFCNMLNYE
jgi:3-oxoacyl-[acyl-carrier-protein] synthase III